MSKPLTWGLGIPTELLKAIEAGEYLLKRCWGARAIHDHRSENPIDLLHDRQSYIPDGEEDSPLLAWINEEDGVMKQLRHDIGNKYCSYGNTPILRYDTAADIPGACCWATKLRELDICEGMSLKNHRCKEHNIAILKLKRPSDYRTGGCFGIAARLSPDYIYITAWHIMVKGYEYELSEAPKYVTQVDDDKWEEFRAGGGFKWSGKYDLPSIGDRIYTPMNGMGYGKVIHYFTEAGFLGVALELEVVPDWHKRQCPGVGVAMCFGAETQLEKEAA